MTMIMKASPAVKAILKVLTTKTTTGLKLRVRKRRMRMKTVKFEFSRGFYFVYHSVLEQI